MRPGWRVLNSKSTLQLSHRHWKGPVSFFLSPFGQDRKVRSGLRQLYAEQRNLQSCPRAQSGW